ncbi:glycosyltransferase [Corynebacterium callunae]|uniref:glycosyltransferase n=1 Tax=Corynebacterium callunae TaxID=1721 RepID=UPI003981C3A9
MKESSPISVLHVVGGMNIGGIQSFLMEVLRNTDSSQVEFIFLCHGNRKWDHAEEVNRLGGKIINIPSITEVGVYSYVKSIRKIIRTYDIEIVHTHLYLASSIVLLAAALEKVPVRIIHSHSTRNELGASLSRKAYVCLTRAMISNFCTLRMSCGTEAGKTFFRGKDFQLINNGINISKFKFNDSLRISMRESLEIKIDSPILLHVGRFIEVKNHKFLIEIFAKFLELQPNSILLLIGDGPTREDTEKLVEKLGIEENVRILGQREDVTNFYNVADILLLPSISEGLPLTLLESQANGLSALVSAGVPLESCVVKDLVNFKDLEDPIEEWAAKMNEIAFHRNEKGAQILRDAGYDSRDSATRLSNIYKSKIH